MLDLGGPRALLACLLLAETRSKWKPNRIIPHVFKHVWARLNSRMPTLDRWFARKAKETSNSFNKGSGAARNHASSDDEDRNSILSSDYNTDEGGDWV